MTYTDQSEIWCVQCTMGALSHAKFGSDWERGGLRSPQTWKLG